MDPGLEFTQTSQLRLQVCDGGRRLFTSRQRDLVQLRLPLTTPLPEGRGYLGRTRRTGQGYPAVTVLHVRWSLGYRFRSTGVDFRRPYGMQAVSHTARRGALHPQPSRAGSSGEE